MQERDFLHSDEERFLYKMETAANHADGFAITGAD
jgi:hypothetical protein